MTNVKTDAQAIITLPFISKIILQPQYDAKLAITRVNAEATNSDITDFCRTCVDFPAHTDLIDASSFQPYFGFMVLSFGVIVELIIGHDTSYHH